MRLAHECLSHLSFVHCTCNITASMFMFWISCSVSSLIIIITIITINSLILLIVHRIAWYLRFFFIFIHSVQLMSVFSLFNSSKSFGYRMPCVCLRARSLPTHNLLQAHELVNWLAFSFAAVCICVFGSLLSVAWLVKVIFCCYIYVIG